MVSAGTIKQICSDPKSLTGQFLSGKRKVSVGSHPPLITSHQSLFLYGCSKYNLKNINVEFPLGKLVSITGVSGSGKSTLLVETLYPALQKELNPLFRGEATCYKRIEGIENVDKVILIDQSPIGRTPRSNPATYTGVFDLIRDVYSLTRDAKTAGYKKGRFSFNVRG